MTDYTRSTGSSATMMIRDVGSGVAGNVEFWLNSNNSTTWSDHLPWGWTINGSTGSSTFNYQPGAGWKRLGVWYVSSAQTVTFRIGSTGTSGFGGPTSFSVGIPRATVPPAPTPVFFSNVASTSLTAQFNHQGNGGAPFTDFHLAYGTDPNTDPYISSTGTSFITGLTPGTTYYFWARSVNTVGAGPWSIRTQVTTLNVPDAPSTPVLSNIQPTSVDVSWTPNGTGGSPITGFQVGYSTTSATQDTIVAAVSPKTISGLIPGTQYFFWVRAQNAVGFGPWSAFASTQTIAGARVLDGGQWKIAVPYVRQGGVWKKAIPWVKHAGEWKETI